MGLRRHPITEDAFLKKNSVREIEPSPQDLRHQYTHYEGRYFEPFVRDVNHTGDVWFKQLDLDADGHPYLYRAIVNAGVLCPSHESDSAFTLRKGKGKSRPTK